jgi:hypothetical protein
MNNNTTTTIQEQRLSLEQFWNLIDYCQLQASANTAQQQQHVTEHERNSKFLSLLTSELFKLTPENIRWFHKHFIHLDTISWRYDLWAVLHIMSGGMSDDAFDYTRAWIIAQGKDFYESTMRDVTSLVPFQRNGRFVSEMEELLSLPDAVFKQKMNGLSLYDIPEDDQQALPDLDEYPTWAQDTLQEPWEDEDLPRLFPEICQLYGFY